MHLVLAALATFFNILLSRTHSSVIAAPTPGNIAHAVEILKRGGLVAFPTETVYGLGADAASAGAVAKIFAAKGRPQDHPVIVHLAQASQIAEWAIDVPDSAHRLASQFWPGPLTMILKRSPKVCDAVTGGQDTVGLRVPGHPVAQQLLRAFGGGLAAPSANRFGRVSPTTAQHVALEFGDKLELVLDGGACDVGIESTIVDLSRGRPLLLRPGRVNVAELKAVLGMDVETVGVDSAAAPRAPGMLEVHYAPDTPLTLLDVESLRAQLRTDTAALALTSPPENFPMAQWIVAPRDARAYARDLYANLRRLDVLGCRRILVENPPADAEWAAINDRLSRAARRYL